MAINKEHPAYPEYIEKCKALSTGFFKEEDKVIARYPNDRGLDHQAGKELRQISLRHNEALKALQREYYYLFADDTANTELSTEEAL